MQFDETSSSEEDDAPRLPTRSGRIKVIDGRLYDATKRERGRCKRGCCCRTTSCICDSIMCPLKLFCIYIVGPFLVISVAVGIFLLVATNKLGSALDSAEVMARSYGASLFEGELQRYWVRGGATLEVTSPWASAPSATDPYLLGWIGARSAYAIEFNLTSRPAFDSTHLACVLSRKLATGATTPLGSFPVAHPGSRTRLECPSQATSAICSALHSKVADVQLFIGIQDTSVTANHGIIVSAPL